MSRLCAPGLGVLDLDSGYQHKLAGVVWNGAHCMDSGRDYFAWMGIETTDLNDRCGSTCWGRPPLDKMDCVKLDRLDVIRYLHCFLPLRMFLVFTLSSAFDSSLS